MDKQIYNLATLNKRIIAISENEGGEMFMGKPDRWYEPPGPKWRCINDHVTSHYLKSEAAGGACCLKNSCGEFVVLTFPEDKEGPLEDKLPTKHTCSRRGSNCSIFSAATCDACVFFLMQDGPDSGWTVTSMAAACTTWQVRREIPADESEFEESSLDQIARIRRIVSNDQRTAT